MGELRLLLFSIIASLRSLLWTLLMLALIFYIFGLCFLQGITTWLESDASSGDNAISAHWKGLADEHFGSVVGSMHTLYLCIAGGLDWGPVSEVLLESGPVYYYLFLFYITFLTFAVLNVFTGLYVERSMATSQADKRAVTKEELKSDLSGF